MPYRSDFAQKATDGWAQLLPDLVLSEDELTAAVRLSRLAQIQARIDDQVLANYDQMGVKSIDDFRCLAYLRRHPTGSTNSVLAEALGGSKSGLSNRLDRFVNHNLTERTPSETDRRSHTNTLTTQGAELTDELTTAIVANRHQLFAQIDPTQIEQLSRTLADIIHHTQT